MQQSIPYLGIATNSDGPWRSAGNRIQHAGANYPLGRLPRNGGADTIETLQLTSRWAGRGERGRT